MVSGPKKGCWPNVEVDENAQEVVLHSQVMWTELMGNSHGIQE